MTAAAGFEIASAGHSSLGTLPGGPSVLGQGQGFASTPGAIFASATTSPASSTPPTDGTGSFRSGWQNLLASMQDETSPTGTTDGAGTQSGAQNGLKNAQGQNASSLAALETTSAPGANGSASLASTETQPAVAALHSSLPIQMAAIQTDQSNDSADKAGAALQQQLGSNRFTRYAAGTSATGKTSDSQGSRSTRETKKEAASNQTSIDSASTAIAQGVNLQAVQLPTPIMIPAVHAATLTQSASTASSSALAAIPETPSPLRNARSSSSLPTPSTAFAAALPIAANASGMSAAGPASASQSDSAAGMSPSSNQPAQALPNSQAQTSQLNFASAAQGTSDTQIGAFAATGRALRDRQVEPAAEDALANPAAQTPGNGLSQASRLATTSFPTPTSAASNSLGSGTGASPSVLSSVNSNENSPILLKQSGPAEAATRIAQPSGSGLAHGASIPSASASVSTSAALPGGATVNLPQTVVQPSTSTASGQDLSLPTQAVASALNPALQQSGNGTQTRASKPASSLPEQTVASASDTPSGAGTANAAVPAGPIAAQTASQTESFATSRNERNAKPSAIKSVRGTSTSGEGAGTAQPTVQTAAVSGTGTAATPTPVATAAALGNHKSSLAADSVASDGTSTTAKTFAALDAEAPGATPTWVSTGIRQAEAGYKDPELGWVGVQAQSSGGVIHASIVPGSTSAAEALSGHLAGLNTFLAENRTAIETLTVAAPEGRSTGQGMDHGANQGQGQATGQGTGQEISQNQGASTGQGSGQGAPAEQYFAPQAIATASTTADSSTIDGSGRTAGNTASQAVNADGNGAHISVIA